MVEQTSNRQSRKTIAWILACLGSFAGALVCCCCLCLIVGLLVFYPKDRSYDFATGAQIIWSMDDADMFPESYLESPNKIRAVKLDESEVDRSVKIIKIALSKYPSALVADTLDRVYLVRTLEMRGAEIGGTYIETETRNFVYLANDGVALGYTELFIERAFHEEYSSILLRKHPRYFDRKAWLKINPKGFKYFGSGFDAIRNGSASLMYDPSLLQDGFTNQYATSEIENDFNAVASRLMAGEEEFWQAMEQYEKIKQKAMLVMEFYMEINPMFTEEYFQSLRDRSR